MTRAVAKRPPPLDDPRWCAMQTVIEDRERQTGAIPLAITDLEKAMASGNPRTMRRDLTTGTPEHLKESFWVKHEIDFGTRTVGIYRRRKGEPRRWGVYAHHHEDRVDGHAYFVWSPDLGKAYGVRAKHDGASAPKPKRKRKTGGGNKPILTAQQIERGKDIYRGMLGDDPTWANSDEASATRIIEKLRLGASWWTVKRWIIVPVKERRAK